MDLLDGSPRERNLLIGMGAVVVLGLLWFVFAGRESAPSAPPDTLDAALRDLQTVETVLASRPSAAATGPRAPFDRGAVIRNAQALDLAISRIEPGVDESITVSFAGTDSPRVVRFLRAITRDTSATISAFEIEATEPGLVEARITLRPAA